MPPPPEPELREPLLIGDEHDPDEPPLPVPGSDEASVVTRRRLGPMFWIALGWLALVVALAVLAPVLPIADPNETLDGPRAGGFSTHNLLGTDDGGRDLLARTIWGSRVSLLVGFTSVAFALLVGGTIGLYAGFYRGWLEKAMIATFDIALAFPAVVLALLLITFLGRELQWILLVLGILAVAPVGRLARANTLVFSQREFVVAARALGARSNRLIWQEIFPNVIVPMTGLALLGMALAIVAEGSLAFLGLSVEGATTTWGKMIVAGSSGTALRENPLTAFVPITAMFLTVLALNFIGDRLRAHFEVRESAL
ncbi:MAG TPA: ABC transporter permease [Acidimicrobiia bacterium]|nr:ABC transporter permease [Acidimicrobiia bacterium]